MECDRYRDAIQELAEGTLGPIRKAELQLHLDQCRACRRLASDLVKIHELAGSLDPVAPPAKTWLQIAGRLRQEGRVTAPPRAASRRNVALLAIAATLVLAVGGAVMMLMQPFRVDTSPGTAAVQQASGNAAPADSVQSVQEEFRLAELHLQNAITRLEQAAGSGNDVMDPETAAELRKNIEVINAAIAESSAALKVDPESEPARNSLFEALRGKVVLLQQTIALMNEMRKGNAAGAAQIVEGANKS